MHGLYVKEAVDYTDRVIEAAKRHGETTIRLIVGSPVSFYEKMILRMRGGFVPRSRFAFQWRGRQIETRHRGVDAKVRTNFPHGAPRPNSLMLFHLTGTICSRRWIQIIPECWSCSAGGSGRHTINMPTRSLTSSRNLVVKTCKKSCFSGSHCEDFPLVKLSGPM